MRPRKWLWIVSVVCLSILAIPRILMALSAGDSNKPTIHVMPVEVLGDVRGTDPEALQNGVRDALIKELRRSGKWQYKTQSPTIEKSGRQSRDLSERVRRSEPAYYVRTDIQWINYLSRTSDRPGLYCLRIWVRIHDTITGETVNGVYAKGYSQHSLNEGLSEKILIEEAIQDAVRTAIQAINSYEVPEGVIIGKQNEEWIIETKKGTIRPGKDLMIIRKNRKYAILRIIRVEPGFSFAIAVNVPSPPTFNDRVVAILKMPYFGVMDDSTPTIDAHFYELLR
jgi:hypothetical protein